MKLKAATRYQMHEMKTPILIFYSIIYLLFLWSATNFRVGFNGYIGGMDFATVIFLFVVGLNSFKGTFRMFLQNSLSRKTLWVSFIITAFLVSGLMALIDRINSIVFNYFMPYHSAFQQFYEHRYGGNMSGIQVFLEGFLWSVFLYAALVLIGFFITALYYRLNRIGKLIVSIGFPIGFIRWLSHVSSDAPITEFTVPNPYSAMVVCAGLIIVFSGLSWLLIRRASVKD